MSTHGRLRIAPTAAAPLTPQQRKFNQLVAKIEVLRERLRQWHDQRPLIAQAHGERVRPLLLQLYQRRRDLALQLDRLLGQPGWTSLQRRTLRTELCDLLAGLIEDELTEEVDATQFKALFDQHAEVDYDTENLDSVQAMKEMFEHATGMNLGDAEFESTDELLRHAQQRLREQTAADDDRLGAGGATRPARPATAKQRRREEEEKAVALSLREIYRKLASALHPDRAQGEEERARCTAMMKRVNEANAAKDLLALFALQLEIEQVDASHIAQASAERARHYNKLLADQVAELQAQLTAQEMSVRVDFGLDPFEPVHPLRLGKLLEQEVHELNAALARLDRDLQQLAEPVSARRWLKRRRQEQKMFDADFDPFDAPF